MEKKNKYYVYLYRRKDNNDVFYVGKGCGNRCKNINQHNQYCQNISNKYGFIIEKIKENISEEEALQLEKDTISYYVNDLGYSIALDNKRNRDSEHFLCNHTLGGEGNYGCHRMSDEEREKRRQNFLGDKNIAKRPEIREKLSKHARENNSFCLEEVKQKLKENHRMKKEENRIKQSEKMKEFYKTEKGKKVKEKMIASKIGKKTHNSIKIYCLEDNKEYDSLNDFGKQYKTDRHTISKLLKESENDIIEIKTRSDYLHISKIPFKE